MAALRTCRQPREPRQRLLIPRADQRLAPGREQDRQLVGRLPPRPSRGTGRARHGRRPTGRASRLAWRTGSTRTRSCSWTADRGRGRCGASEERKRLHLRRARRAAVGTGYDGSPRGPSGLPLKLTAARTCPCSPARRRRTRQAPGRPTVPARPRRPHRRVVHVDQPVVGEPRQLREVSRSRRHRTPSGRPPAEPRGAEQRLDDPPPPPSAAVTTTPWSATACAASGASST